MDSIPNGDGAVPGALVQNLENDDALGQDWLRDDDLQSLDGEGERLKRATGTSIDNAVTNLIEVGSQTISSFLVDKGDSFTFKFIIDLPAIPEQDKSDLNIEIFVLEPTTGEAKLKAKKELLLFAFDF